MTFNLHVRGRLGYLEHTSAVHMTDVGGIERMCTGVTHSSCDRHVFMQSMYMYMYMYEARKATDNVHVHAYNC